MFDLFRLDEATTTALSNLDQAMLNAGYACSQEYSTLNSQSCGESCYDSCEGDCDGSSKDTSHCLGTCHGSCRGDCGHSLDD